MELLKVEGIKKSFGRTNVLKGIDFSLEKGMIITDEPGIYQPVKFGVRIEDMVCVTENGCKNFVSLPKELIIL